jgi:ankyrin repeat protein
MGHLEVVERLIAAPGADINKVRSTGATPLAAAIAFGNAEVAQALRAAGAIEPPGSRR